MSVYRHIVVLTGAGISAESGLATFRGADGLWNNRPVEEVATIEAFERNPAYVHDFYNELKPEVFKARPNPAHLALAKLQKEYPGHVCLITQNVDTLHEKAGSIDVCHIHGRIDQAVCLNCGQIMEATGDIDTQTACPHCQVAGMMKPNIVFFGENLLDMDNVERQLHQCDLFLSIGTSGIVFPAAGFVQTAKYVGAETYEFNLEPTSNNFYFDHHIMGPAGTTIPQFVDKLLQAATERKS